MRIALRPSCVHLEASLCQGKVRPHTSCCLVARIPVSSPVHNHCIHAVMQENEVSSYFPARRRVNNRRDGGHKMMMQKMNSGTQRWIKKAKVGTIQKGIEWLQGKRLRTWPSKSVRMSLYRHSLAQADVSSTFIASKENHSATKFIMRSIYRTERGGFMVSTV